MAMFLGVHDFGGPLTQEQAKDAWMRYSQSAEKNGAKALKVYFNPGEGKSFCVTEAESADVVNKAHNDVNLPTKELHEVEKFKN